MPRYRVSVTSSDGKKVTPPFFDHDFPSEPVVGAKIGVAEGEKLKIVEVRITAVDHAKRTATAIRLSP